MFGILLRVRLIKRLLSLVVALAVLFAGWATAIAVTTPDPQPRAGWTRLKDLPRPRGEMTAAVVARLDGSAAGTGAPERIAVVGGLEGLLAATSRAVDFYDPSADRWTRGPDLPEARHHPAAAGFGGALYVGGGSEKATDWSPQREVWLLLPTSEAWERVTGMPEGRMAHQMVAVGTKLYVIGGRGETSDVLIFDARAGAWSRGAAMPVKRDHLAAVVVGTRIYAIGGRADALVDRVDVYDTLTDRWTEGPRLPVPMSAMAAGVTTEPDAGIHVVGGEDPATIGGGVIPRHSFLAPGASRWIDAPMPVIATHGSAAVVIQGHLHIAGGARRQGALSVLSWTGVLQRLGT